MSGRGRPRLGSDARTVARLLARGGDVRRTAAELGRSAPGVRLALERWHRERFGRTRRPGACLSRACGCWPAPRLVCPACAVAARRAGWCLACLAVRGADGACPLCGRGDEIGGRS